MRMIVIIVTMGSGLALIATPQEHFIIKVAAGITCLIGITVMMVSGPPRRDR